MRRRRETVEHPFGNSLTDSIRVLTSRWISVCTVSRVRLRCCSAMAAQDKSWRGQCHAFLGQPYHSGGSRARLQGSAGRRVSAVVPEAYRFLVFGPLDLSDAIGNSDDQRGLRRALPLTARRLTKVGRAVS
jgi:hypothetical protein